MLQLLKNLRSRTQINDADILKWANRKVKNTGRNSRIESFKVKTGSFFLYWRSYVLDFD